MPKRMINFDLDTKRFETITGRSATIAYRLIRKYFEKNEFEHRQGSCYVSKHSITNEEVYVIVTNLSVKYNWLKYCTKQIDVTSVGKQYSLLDAINEVEDNENIEIISNSELINEEQNIEDDFDMDICDY